jgi:hypothetical protein
MFTELESGWVKREKSYGYFGCFCFSVFLSNQSTLLCRLLEGFMYDAVDYYHGFLLALFFSEAISYF